MCVITLDIPDLELLNLVGQASSPAVGMEDAAEAVAEDADPSPEGEEAPSGNKKVFPFLVYLHTGHTERGDLGEDDFCSLTAYISGEVELNFEREEPVLVDIVWMGYHRDRKTGIMAAADLASREFVVERVENFIREGKVFRAWRKGEGDLYVLTAYVPYTIPGDPDKLVKIGRRLMGFPGTCKVLGVDGVRGQVGCRILRLGVSRDLLEFLMKHDLKLKVGMGTLELRVRRKPAGEVEGSNPD